MGKLLPGTSAVKPAWTMKSGIKCSQRTIHQDTAAASQSSLFEKGSSWQNVVESLMPNQTGIWGAEQ